MQKEITLQLIRVTEAAALNASKYLGLGNKELIDQAAVDAMRGMLELVDVKGKVVIGEGEKDKAPMLYIGEEVGNWSEDSPEMDIAVDPIDGTRLVANGLPNAIAVMAAAERGKLASLPTFYCEKLACGPELKGKLDINASVRENLKIAAAILGLEVSELTIVVLNRPRHEKLIEEIRKVGARIQLISDGDIAAAIASALPGSGVNLYMGIGGSPEAVLAAAALKSLGGEIQIKLHPTDEERERLEDLDTEKVYLTEDLAGGENVVFSATGVTDGDLLKGVRYSKKYAVTYTIAMRSKSHTIRKVEAFHDLNYKTIALKSAGVNVKFEK
jgi:fructose-1,6-bisphosphatase II